MLLFEYATKTNHRNMFASAAQFRSIAQQSAGKGKQLLRSLFAYDQAELTAHIKIEGGIAKFDGIIYPSHVFIDVDGHDITDAQLCKRIEQAVSALHITNDVPPECCQYFFTGRGVHIMIHQNLFKFQPSANMHRIVKAVVWELLLAHEWLDDIYSKSHLIRWTNHMNQATGFYKIPIPFSTVSNIKEKDIESLRQLAKEPVLDFDYSLFAESGGLHDLSKLTRDAERTYSSLLSTGKASGSKGEDLDPLAQNRRKLTCLHHMLEADPTANRRHRTIGAVSCGLRRQGVPMELVMSGLESWIRRGDLLMPDNQRVYTTEHIRKQVKHWYEKGYAPSCTGNNPYSKIMQEHCDPACMFFSKKSIDGGVTGAEDAIAQLKQRLEWIKTGNYINLGKIFGDQNSKLRIFPGNVCVLIGDTGIGKTKIMQWLILQLNRPVFWMSLEMDIGSMTERFAQQLLGCDEETLAINFHKYEQAIAEAIGGIHQTTESLTIEEIVESASANNINTIVIDHLGLLTSRYERDARLHVGSLMKEMRAAARTKGLSFLVLSHISRGAAAQGKLNAHSGLDSGAIERDTHILLGLEVQSPTTVKLTCLKQTHGPTGMEYLLASDKETNMFYTSIDPMFDIVTQTIRPKK